MIPSLNMRSKEEREASHREWIEKHYLVPGKRYTFETAKYWRGGYNLLGGRNMEWTVYIKEADCPWMICALESFKLKVMAEKWGRDYLKRGGPPEGYFDAPLPDPNIVTYQPESTA